MSTLNVANISDGTDTVGTSYVVNGSAKAWVNYSMAAALVGDSFNVSSTSDFGVGSFGVTLTNGMSNDKYSAGSSNAYPSSGSSRNYSSGVSSFASGSFSYAREASTGAGHDSNAYGHGANIYGDLA